MISRVINDYLSLSLFQLDHAFFFLSRNTKKTSMAIGMKMHVFGLVGCLVMLLRLVLFAMWPQKPPNKCKQAKIVFFFFSIECTEITFFFFVAGPKDKTDGSYSIRKFDSISVLPFQSSPSSTDHSFSYDQYLSKGRPTFFTSFGLVVKN